MNTATEITTGTAVGLARRLTARLLCREHRDTPVSCDPRGWLYREVSFAVPKGEEPLAVHGGWAGPVKLVRRRNRWQAVREVYVSPSACGQERLSSAADEEWESFLGALADTVFGCELGHVRRDWTPPPVDRLVGWLKELGYSPATDERENLRLTVKGRGREGQVCVRRGPGQLRLVMQLGTWPQLGPQAERAMLQLSAQCNAGCRLARIAWYDGEGNRRCEAQVDLTGLPIDDWAATFWSGMLRQAVLGLELAMRQLALELELLANPVNAKLAERVGGRGCTRSRRPR